MKIMVSACLTGENCKYNGGNNRNNKILRLLEGNQVIPVCPEQMGGLPTPRVPSEIRNGTVMAKDGRNIDSEFRTGAAKCLEIARHEQPDLVVLQSRSPSCGVKQRYDGTFSGSLIRGAGVTAQLLMENGFQAVEAEDLLVTDRLLLRKWADRDAKDLYRYASDPEVGLIAGWPPHSSVSESLDVIRNILNGAETYAVCLKTDGRAIGAIGLKLEKSTGIAAGREDTCELGYWLGKPFWSRGIMTEAVREMIRHGFEELGVRTIWCEYYEGNIGSRRVQEKCGFHYQKTIREADVPLLHEKRTVYVNSLNRAEYQERKDELSC